MRVAQGLFSAAMLIASVGANATTIQSPTPIVSAGVLALSAETTSAGTTGSGLNETLPTPGSFHYGQTFSGAAGTGSIVGTPGAAGYGYGFYDTFVFTVSASNASSITSTIDLGTSLQISGLQERLYAASPGDATPVLGLPAAATNGGGLYFEAWSQPITIAGSNVGTVAVLSQTTPLPAGTYVLEIRGTVTGSAGGSYAGTLNVNPVPLPAALPLLFSGLGMLGLLRRRRP